MCVLPNLTLIFVYFMNYILFHGDVYISHLVNGYESKTLMFLIQLSVNIMKPICCKTLYI